MKEHKQGKEFGENADVTQGGFSHCSTHFPCFLYLYTNRVQTARSGRLNSVKIVN